MEAIILAGGVGTRLQPVVSDVPKPMAPIHGRPFLEWLMDYWVGQGAHRIILAVGYKYEMIRKHFGDSYKKVRVDYSIESEPLGTGGGLILAMEMLESEETFLVLNGDTYFEVPFLQFYKQHENHEAEMSIALFPVSSIERYGAVHCDSHHVITSFSEKSDMRGAGLINGGVYLMEKVAFHMFLQRPERNRISFEKEILPIFLDKGTALYGFDFPNKFVDIGIPADYEKAEDILRR